MDSCGGPKISALFCSSCSAAACAGFCGVKLNGSRVCDGSRGGRVESGRVRAGCPTARPGAVRGARVLPKY